MASRKILIVNLKDDACVFFFFWYNQGYPERWPRLIPFRTGWQVLPKRPAADEERGRTPDLVSDESTPNHSARTPWVMKAFIEHKEKLSGNLDKVKCWSDCLSTVANLSGWDVRNR